MTLKKFNKFNFKYENLLIDYFEFKFDGLLFVLFFLLTAFKAFDFVLLGFPNLVSFSK